MRSLHLHLGPAASQVFAFNPSQSCIRSRQLTFEPLTRWTPGQGDLLNLRVLGWKPDGLITILCCEAAWKWTKGSLSPLGTKLSCVCRCVRVKGALLGRNSDMMRSPRDHDGLCWRSRGGFLRWTKPAKVTAAAAGSRVPGGKGRVHCPRLSQRKNTLEP